MVTTANPITLETYPLSTGFGLDPDSFVEQMFSNGKIPAYPRETVVLIAQELAARSREFSDDGRSVAGQIAHETNFLRYTGDSQPYQYNFGGIGTTGGGVHGENYSVVTGTGVDVPASVKAGVLAMFTHRSAYMRGPKAQWPLELQQYWGASHREKNVVAAGFAGTVHQQKDFGNGKWAVGPKYAEGITKAANLFRADTGGNGGVYMPKIAVGAGHRNTSGGNARERDMTAPLTKTYVDTLRRWGYDVRCYTPNEGLGMYPGTLSQAVNEVNKWAAQGWVADVLAELHFQGLGANSDAGRGYFVIYPDWTGDTDTDVTGIFAQHWVPEFGVRTGLPKYGNGTMSEKRTSVGAAGDRLGVFSTTVGLKQTTTRMIIEHGCHTCPSDYAIIDDGQVFYDHCADAFAAAVGKWYNVAPPGGGGTGPWAPSGPSGGVPDQWNGNTYYLIGQFWQEYHRLGNEFTPTYGLIASGMNILPVDGTDRYVQFTEKGAMAAYPLGLPHGVPEHDPMLIRNLFPHERAAALAVAHERGVVDPELR
jgi:hypothetical protein